MITDETRTQLVSFGEYLLSDYRKSMVEEANQHLVHHADIENWLHFESIAQAFPAEGVSPTATEILNTVNAN